MSFIDARRLAPGTAIRADVCVVGSGAAGTTLAQELAGQGASVALIESGDRTFRHRTQFLYIGENAGVPNFATTHSRFRQFGGSLTRWAGQCRPFEAIDFEARAWVPGSGWPFGRDHLEPYYRRADELCGLGPCDYGPGALDPGFGRTLLPESGQVETRIFRFTPPEWMVESSERAFEGSPKVQVYLNANVTQLRVDAANRAVSHLELATLGGRCFSASATSYVLACGGIENARILLASDRDVPGGVGNQADLVGRYFMDHPYLWMGHFEPTDESYGRAPYVIEDYSQTGRAQRLVAGFGLSDHVLRSERLNNAALYLVRRHGYKSRAAYFSSGGLSFQHLGAILRHDAVPDRHVMRHLRNALLGSGDIGATLLRWAAELFRSRPRVGLRALLEATPCRDSRVTLSDRRDRLGMPRVRVDWQLNEDDRRGLFRLMQAMREEIERLQLGRLIEYSSTNAAGWPSSMTGGKHHMGTTRMHPDPQQGVVDADCRVHGLSNLFVAGGSVFPTGGAAHPTLTIVALAIRLADHLGG